MTMKVVDHFIWKANAFNQSSDIQSAILVRLQTNDRGRFGLSDAEG